MITVKIRDLPEDLRIDRREVRHSVRPGDGFRPLTCEDLRSAGQYLDGVRTGEPLPSRHVRDMPAPRPGPEGYPFVFAGWELTEACNMRCRHCMGAAGRRAAGELSTRLALGLCDQLADLGARSVALSGGEPLLRRDWPKIVQRLAGREVHVGMTSNGWLIDRQTVRRAEDAGLGGMTVSLDGLEPTHDAIRRRGSFRRCLRALAALGAASLPAGVKTTVAKGNLAELEALEGIVTNSCVRTWYLQLALPAGNMLAHRQEVLEPPDVLGLLDFVESVRDAGALEISIGDGLGYYTKTTAAIRRARSGDPDCLWPGCLAGKTGLHVRANGDVSGCCGLRTRQYVEGNIRDVPLRELWTRRRAFAWNRERTRRSLTGFCRACRYADLCLGGCTTVREMMCPIEGDNPYCAYRMTVEALFRKADATRGVRARRARAAEALELGLVEIADRLLRTADGRRHHRTNTDRKLGARV